MNNNYTSIDYLGNTNSVVPQKNISVGGAERREAGFLKEAGESYIQEIEEYEPKEEVKKYVAHRKETVGVSPDMKKVGVVSTGHPKFTSKKKIKLPISDDRVFQGLHASITTSFRWLAEFCLRILKIGHVTLKEIHGKVMRVTNS